MRASSRALAFVRFSPHPDGPLQSSGTGLSSGPTLALRVGYDGGINTLACEAASDNIGVTSSTQLVVCAGVVGRNSCKCIQVCRRGSGAEQQASLNDGLRAGSESTYSSSRSTDHPLHNLHRRRQNRLILSRARRIASIGTPVVAIAAPHRRHASAIDHSCRATHFPIGAVPCTLREEGRAPPGRIFGRHGASRATRQTIKDKTARSPYVPYHCTRN